MKSEQNLDEARKRLLEIILEYGFERGVFRLTSGKLGAYYIDCRKVSLHPEGASLIGTLLLNELRGLEVDAIGGLTLGADPVVTAVAISSFQETNNPINAFIVRKEAKQHGKNQGIEGPDLKDNAKIAIVDDVITTGGSALQAVERVESVGGQVQCILSIVDRLEGGRETMENLGYTVKSIFTIEDLGITKGRMKPYLRHLKEKLKM